jgi:hypothetical protein
VGGSGEWMGLPGLWMGSLGLSTDFPLFCFFIRFTEAGIEPAQKISHLA